MNLRIPYIVSQRQTIVEVSSDFDDGWVCCRHCQTCRHTRWRKPKKMCRNMPFCGRARRGSRVRFPKEERCAESPPTFICEKRRKNRRKPVKTKILSSGVVFTFEEGISTSHVCLKGQQPIFRIVEIVLP